MIILQSEIDLPAQINRQMLQESISMTLSVEEKMDLDVTLRLADDAEIHQLNRRFRNKNQPTDVLSFNYNCIDPETGREHLGDIIISIETAIRQAEEHNFTINQELAYLAIHGTLHLLGYDHQVSEQKNAMFDLQEEIFGKILSSFKEEMK